jgi:multidrug resistance efflux pump
MPAPTDAVLADQEALAESALRREQLNLEKCMLRAPRDGVILETYGQVGELIGPLADRPLLTFADAGPRRARAFVEELDALDVAPGQSAVVLVSGKADRKYEGKVLECSPYVRPKTHRHLRPGERLDVRVREVLIQLDDAEDLLIGLPVEVYVKP